MSGRYLYCQNRDCWVYLGSLGGDDCHICGWRSGTSEDAPDSQEHEPEPPRPTGHKES